MSVLAMNQPPPPPVYNVNENNKNLLTAVPPAWGSYLYSNFLQPAFSPSEWLATSPAIAQTQTPGSIDYFNNTGSDGQTWPAGVVKVDSNNLIDIKPSALQLEALRAPPYTIPSNSASSTSAPYYPGYYYPDAPSIPTSLLTSSSSSNQGQTISPSIDIIDTQVIAEPSPLSSTQTSPKRAAKRRASSLDTDESDHEHEHEHEVPEGVERDGMIWGMRVEAYRALSARERKRVRNRISARTFRAKRKEHLSSLETTLNNKDNLIRRATDEAAQLRRELAEVKRRLAKYEAI